MIEFEKGKIYSFVGPAGGGKSYSANKICKESEYYGVPCIETDFSNGIRETLGIIISGKNSFVDINSKEYAEWKEMTQCIIAPNGNVCYINGRTMLKNLGEFLKDKVYNEIWANWALNDVMNKYFKMNVVDRTACNIVFGSLRFESELKSIIKCAELTHKEIEIRFCNYFQEKPKEGYIHPSEEMAQRLLTYGAKHNDIVNEYFTV